MTGSIIAILILLIIAITVSAFCHSIIRSFFGASIASALVSTILFQFAAYIELGYLDPFFLIAIVTGAFYALLISLPVGIVTRAIRSRRTPTSTHPNVPRRHSNDADHISDEERSA